MTVKLAPGGVVDFDKAIKGKGAAAARNSFIPWMDRGVAAQYCSTSSAAN